MPAMKIVIHAGMHKTGTSTIQKTFSALAGRQEVYAYAPAPGPDHPDHNSLFILGFHDEEELENYYLFRHQDMRLPQLLRLKQEIRARLDAALAECARSLFLFSQEAMRGHFWGGVRRFADYCRSKADDIQVLVYVRPPVSFSASMYQEIVKLDLVTRATPLAQSVEYRRRFQPVIDCFGAERVRFKLYDRARLKGGDVALDFAAEIGVALSPSEVIHRNESLGLETVALLYAFKSLLPPRRPAPYRLWQNDKFVAALAPFGALSDKNRRLRFTPQLAKRLIASQQADIKWMEQRLGASLEEDLDPAPADAATPISKAEDLLPIAEAQTEAVEELAATLTGFEPPAGASKRARLLYALTAIHDHDNRATGALAPTFYTGLR